MGGYFAHEQQWFKPKHYEKNYENLELFIGVFPDMRFRDLPDGQLAGVQRQRQRQRGDDG
jgi:hypothetical protein